MYDTDNHGEAGGDNFMEGQLDVEMISTFGLGATTLVSNTNTTASTEEGSGFGAALLDFLTELAGRDAAALPHVLSMSLGSLSAYSCDLLCGGVAADASNFTRSECEAYMQTQRQVCMFVSEDQTARISVKHGGCEWPIMEAVCTRLRIVCNLRPCDEARHANSASGRDGKSICP